jgi:hypothetical protein
MVNNMKPRTIEQRTAQIERLNAKLANYGNGISGDRIVRRIDRARAARARRMYEWYVNQSK